MAPVGIAYVGYQPAPVQYVFVHTNNFTERNVRTHAIVGAQAQVIVRQTEPMASVQVERGHAVSAVHAGPKPEVIGQATGHTVTPVSVHTVAAAAPPRATPGVRYGEGASAEHPIAVRGNAPAARSEAARPATPNPGAKQAEPNQHAEPARQAAPAGPAHGDTLKMAPAAATHAPPPASAPHANESPARHRAPSMGSSPRPPAQPIAAPARSMEHQAPPARPLPPTEHPPEARPAPMPPPVAHPAKQQHPPREGAPHAAAGR
jgi:hypothetical protein